jgi:hypothetical protein
MQRCVYRAHGLAGAEERALGWLGSRYAAIQKRVEQGELMTLSLFRWQEQFFLYYECTDRLLSPTELWGDGAACLRAWPGSDGERHWVPMMDIYHAVQPVGVEHWRRREAVQTVTGRLMRLRPELLSSYIFYHYQLQEERPGNWSKYAAIYLHENLTFMYKEVPDPVEPPPYTGKLTTTNTPGGWQELMFGHCQPWEDVGEQERMWRSTTLVWRV